MFGGEEEKEGLINMLIQKHKKIESSRAKLG